MKIRENDNGYFEQANLEISGIVFYSPEEANKFFSQLGADFKEHIAEDSFKNKIYHIFTREGRRAYRQIKIQIGDKKNNKDSIPEYSIKATGIVLAICDFEAYVKNAFNARRIVCYKPEHYANSEIGDEILGEYDESFETTNTKRYGAFLSGKFKAPSKNNIWKNRMCDGLDAILVGDDTTKPHPKEDACKYKEEHVLGD